MTLILRRVCFATSAANADTCQIRSDDWPHYIHLTHLNLPCQAPRNQYSRTREYSTLVRPIGIREALLVSIGMALEVPSHLFAIC